MIVRLLRRELLRRELLQPLLDVGMEARFVVVDEDGRGNVHRIHEADSLPDLAFCQRGLDLRGDVDQLAPARHLEPEFLSVGLHGRRAWTSL
jgi:hypothetical protein